MSEPKRIWVDPENNDGSGVWFIAGTRPRLAKQDVEYIRAPDQELMERVRAMTKDYAEQYGWESMDVASWAYSADVLLRDLLHHYEGTDHDQR